MFFNDTEFIRYGKRIVIKVNYHKNGIPKNTVTISCGYLSFVTSYKSICDISYASIADGGFLREPDKSEHLKEVIARRILTIRYELIKELEMLSNAIGNKAKQN